MRDFAVTLLTAAATRAGLPAERVQSLSAADNLTLPRPRLEYQFLPVAYARTGRKIGLTRAGALQTAKKELYEVRLDLTANVLADNAAWLAAFEPAFVKAFPRGGNDAEGNWVKVRVQKATFTQPPVKRVGNSEISVFVKLATLFALTLTGRLTEESTQHLIRTVTIAPPEWRDGKQP